MSGNQSRSPYRSVVKPLLDRIGGIVLLLAFSPLMILVGALVWLTDGRPVLFSQARPGLDGRIFQVLKFRTMSSARTKTGELLPDAQRLTRLGRFLRTTSIDELPELINVVRGEMSLVGPRPLLVEYLARYSATQARRHEVRPGMTGWAQVNGRNAITWEQKFQFDVWYADNLSFWIDLKILAMTLGTVFRADRISHQGHATMPEFRGSGQERIC